jgi:hypothetical protein
MPRLLLAALFALCLSACAEHFPKQARTINCPVGGTTCVDDLGNIYTHLNPDNLLRVGDGKICTIYRGSNTFSCR